MSNFHSQFEELEQIYNATLEWDRKRGVLYVHNPEGRSVLRICGLPKSQTGTLLDGEGMIDITLPRRRVK